jgi:hypothetical protein
MKEQNNIQFFLALKWINIHFGVFFYKIIGKVNHTGVY